MGPRQRMTDKKEPSLQDCLRDRGSRHPICYVREAADALDAQAQRIAELEVCATPAPEPRLPNPPLCLIKSLLSANDNERCDLPLGHEGSHHIVLSAPRLNPGARIAANAQSPRAGPQVADARRLLRTVEGKAEFQKLVAALEEADRCVLVTARTEADEDNTYDINIRYMNVCPWMVEGMLRTVLRDIWATDEDGDDE